MRHRRELLPTPRELATAPELAILAALEAAIDVALVALVAAHHELQATEDGTDPASGLVACAADNVIDKAQALAAAIIGYRLVVVGDIGVTAS
jgi:hypothetical protein